MTSLYLQSSSHNPTQVSAGPSQVILCLPALLPFSTHPPSPNPLMYPLNWVLTKKAVATLVYVANTQP